jgi:L,D-peptidoglycan transpeptidase YkuD (ErfK/YbiS/YcfS/YnhG family)
LKSVPLTFIVSSLLLILAACKTPPAPPEVEQAKTQENDLWRAGAPVYAAEDYANYLQSLRFAKDRLIKEKAKFGWFRDYEEIKANYLVVLAEGDAILRKVKEEKELKSRDVSGRLALLRDRIGKLKKVSLTMNENAPVRRNLAQAEVASQEVEILFRQEKYNGLAEKIKMIDLYVVQAEETFFSILSRYADEAQVEQWRKWANETIAESRKKGGAAILVNKLERTLSLYRKGKLLAVYEIGLGKYGLSDKLYAGDEATPEGKYRVVKKLANSRYYKALLIDYPNEEDKKHFSQAKRKGLIPPRAGIGGLIEIHGGGNDNITNGCIGVEDKVMDQLFPEVGLGTPITIIGSLESAERLLASLRKSI